MGSHWMMKFSIVSWTTWGPFISHTASQTTNKAADTSVRNSNAGSKEENGIPPAVVPTGTSEEKQVAADSLGDVGSKVQQEIGKEFAAMMASGTVRATEAATLAPAGPTTCMGYLGTSLA
ncbi:hypothetical protein Tco_0037085 [Tanacetum coccineum]